MFTGLDYYLTTDDNYFTVEHLRHAVKHIALSAPPPLHNEPPGSVHLQIFGTKGGLNTWVNLNAEQRWLLADMLLEGLDALDAALGAATEEG